MDETYAKKLFGARLRQALDDKGIPQVVVAEKLGITQSAVSAWCSGKSDINLTKAGTLARILGVSLDWLVGLTDERTEAPTTKDQAAASLMKFIERVGIEEAWNRLSSSPSQPLIGMGATVTGHPSPPTEPWDGGATPNPEELKNFLGLMQHFKEIETRRLNDAEEKRISQIEERMKAAEKKLDQRGRPRNTVGEKKRKAQ